MRSSRRALVLGAPALWLASGLESASADTATYQYDALGRLTRVTFGNGAFVSYAYDPAGNRLEVIRSDNSTFTATLQITGTNPVNLRTLANANGYAGAQNVNITFLLGAAVTITGAGGPGDGGIAIDTGLWSSNALSISLALQISGKVRGGGGAGGMGAGSAAGSPGGRGGDAIYCRENISITVNAGGEVRAGGGGGGGGQAWWRTDTSESFYYNGGGGGGGYPNGPGGPEGFGDFDASNPGSAGTASGGGAGGSGGGSTPTASRINGAGGAGGGAAQSGSLGGGVSGTSTTPVGWIWESTASGQGGAPGYAVRKNGKTVTVTNNGGTISGTVG